MTPTELLVSRWRVQHGRRLPKDASEVMRWVQREFALVCDEPLAIKVRMSLLLLEPCQLEEAA